MGVEGLGIKSDCCFDSTTIIMGTVSGHAGQWVEKGALRRVLDLLPGRARTECRQMIVKKEINNNFIAGQPNENKGMFCIPALRCWACYIRTKFSDETRRILIKYHVPRLRHPYTAG